MTEKYITGWPTRLFLLPVLPHARRFSDCWQLPPPPHPQRLLPPPHHPSGAWSITPLKTVLYVLCGLGVCCICVVQGCATFVWLRTVLYLCGWGLCCMICVVENSAVLFVWWGQCYIICVAKRTVLYYLCGWGRCYVCLAEDCAMFVWLVTVLCLCSWGLCYVCLADDSTTFVWLRTVLCLCSWGLCCVCVAEDSAILFVWLRTVLCLCGWGLCCVCVAEDCAVFVWLRTVTEDSTIFVWLRTVLCLCGWGQRYVYVAEDCAICVWLSYLSKEWRTVPLWVSRRAFSREVQSKMPGCPPWCWFPESRRPSRSTCPSWRPWRLWWAWRCWDRADTAGRASLGTPTERGCAAGQKQKAHHPSYNPMVAYRL